MHPLTGAPLRALGFTRRGAPMWPVLGGAESDGGEGGGGEGDGDGNDGGEGAAGGDPDRTFKSADVDRIVRDRLARQAAKFGDYAALKEKATKFDEIEKANLSALEKEKARADAAERNATAAQERVVRTMVRAELVTEATRLNAIDPSDVVALLAGNGDIKTDAEGNVTGARAAVEALAKSKPHLFAGKGNAGPNGGTRQSDQGTRGTGAAGASTVGSGRDLWATRHAKPAKS